MPSNNQIPARIRNAAVELARGGASPKDVAAQISKRFKRKVSATSVRNWKLAAEAGEDDAPPSSAAPASTPEPPADAPEPEPEAPPGDLLKDTRRMLRDAQALARQASADGNHAAAQRAQKNAADLAKLLARLEKERSVGGEGVTYTAEQVAAADREIDERVVKLAADLVRTGGLVCSHCGRELRVKIAKGEL